MSELFTEDELLVLSKQELEVKVQESVPPVEGEFFTPELIRPSLNPVRKRISELRGSWMRRHDRLVKIQMWLVPAFILVPAGIAILLKLDATVPAFLFVGAIVFTLGYFWFTGRISGWRSRKYEEHSLTAEKEAERLVDVRAVEWANRRYQLPKGKVEWSAYGSEFKLADGTYHWSEKIDDGYQITKVGTELEPPLRTKS